MSVGLRTFVHVKPLPGDSVVLDLPDVGVQRRWATASLLRLHATLFGGRTPQPRRLRTALTAVR